MFELVIPVYANYTMLTITLIYIIDIVLLITPKIRSIISMYLTYNEV